MKISIITAAYNCSDLIYETYHAISAQTYNNWEWLVTDDCSGDNTFEVLTKIAKLDDRVKVFSNKVNSGAAVSRNLSLGKSTGEFIAFIDSDDIWHPTKLEEQIKFMGNSINFSFTAYELIDPEGKLLDKKVDSNQKGQFSYNDMLKKKATLGCSTVIIRNGVFTDLTMPLLRTGQDYAFWLKLLKTGEDAHILPKVLTQYRIMPNSISRNKIKKAKRQWQIYREIEKINLLESICLFCFYAYRAVFRK